MSTASQAALRVAILLCGLCNLPVHGDSLAPSAIISKQRITAKGREHIHGSVSGRRPRPTKEFVYVYDMPAKFTSDIKKLSMEWHPEQYDYDQVLHEHFLNSPARTEDAEQAQLFFIPVYLGRYYNWYWQQWSTPGNPWEIVTDCEPRHRAGSPECWWEKWMWGKGNTSELVREALEYVQKQHPYWSKHDGADHVMVFSYDHARCDMALTNQLSTFGQMFSIQSYGDLTLTNDPTVPPIIQRWQDNNYTWGQPRSWACFRPDADVLVPMYYNFEPQDLVSPFGSERSITALLRFDYKRGDGKNLVEHYGHRLRHELIEYWRGQPLEGSQQGPKSSEETDADMARSIFCVCPPGATQDTTRMFRAILKGCIPVTFFRANDLPFARFLGVPYGEFMLNIQPDDYPQLNDRISRILASPQRLRHMQDALVAYQKNFLWSGGSEDGGVIANVERELSIRATMLHDTPHSTFSR
ncbi:g6241 [Coccomyxa elongata]